jgi:hypothetical protein
MGWLVFYMTSLSILFSEKNVLLVLYFFHLKICHHILQKRLMRLECVCDVYKK